MKKIILIAARLAVLPAVLAIVAVPGMLIGACSGYGLGGPIGAIFGAAFGPLALASSRLAKIRL